MEFSRRYIENMPLEEISDYLPCGSKKQIAGNLGISPQTISRAFSKDTNVRRLVSKFNLMIILAESRRLLIAATAKYLVETPEEKQKKLLKRTGMTIMSE